MQAEENTEDLGDSSISTTLSSHKKRSSSQRDLTPGLYSIFSKARKIVHLIRHGHTTYSEGSLRTKLGNHPFDVILSPLGIKQASSLSEKIFCLGAEAILTSPLTRALQTLQNAVDLTQAGRVEVSHLHTEHVSSSGDVGRPPSMLSREFPMLSFTGLEEVWWFSPRRAPNDPIKGVFHSRESMDHLRKRVGLFRQYLLSRPESTIVVIGHSTFFKELSGRRKRMENCEILTIRV
ncbi:hypothetical protein GOP47_0025284 [Adiantum capillus-veneris]|uniref:Uncharacterized protein n=1 Tax=Adiantum capillus-veneris TaxID=13818 RepID=A0A9D4U180_ADICA|nr:hypothetical protein GOP47_0025284 [Adiantum capillus-veneris]